MRNSHLQRLRNQLYGLRVHKEDGHWYCKAMVGDYADDEEREAPLGDLVRGVHANYGVPKQGQHAAHEWRLMHQQHRSTVSAWSEEGALAARPLVHLDLHRNLVCLQGGIRISIRTSATASFIELCSPLDVCKATACWNHWMLNSLFAASKPANACAEGEQRIPAGHRVIISLQTEGTA